jgi:hypothetical protein
MSEFLKDRFFAPRALFRSAWIPILALACLVLAASSTISFSARAHTASGTRTHTAWAAYRPFVLSLGRDPGMGGRGLAVERFGGWCSRTTTQGSTPWGSWEAVLVTCLHTPLLPGPSALGHDKRMMDQKEFLQ